jgi:hypothetical protein
MNEPTNQLHLYATILRVSNLEASAQWYEQILELKREFQDLGYPLVSLIGSDNVRIALWQMQAGETIVPVTRESGFVTFITQDAIAAHAFFSGRGASVSPMDYSKPGVSFFWTFDPDHHAVLIIQLLPD